MSDKKDFFNTQLLLVAAVVLSMGWFFMGFVSGKGDCDVPSTSTKKCIDVDDEVEDCSQATYLPGDCVTAGARYIYEIADFPYRRVESDAGHTKEEYVDCWRRKGCIPDNDTHTCIEAPSWSGYTRKPMIVVMDNDPCE